VSEPSSCRDAIALPRGRVPSVPSRVRVVVFVLVLASNGPFLGSTVASNRQTPRSESPRDTAIIVGQVIDRETGSPIRHPVVSLVLQRQSGETSAADESPNRGPLNQRVVGDRNGRFVFEALPPGTASISATALGYQPGSYGQVAPDSPSLTHDVKYGERSRPLLVRLSRAGSVSGTVVDEAGEPAVGVNVRLLRRSNRAEADVVGYRMATTDDRGVYRFGLLPPETFIVAIPNDTAALPVTTVDQFHAPGTSAGVRLSLHESGGALPSQLGTRMGDLYMQPSMAQPALRPLVDAKTGDVWVYRTVYYPSADTVGSATPISVTPGREVVGVNFTLTPVKAYRVQGSVTGPVGPLANVGVRLSPVGPDDNPDRSRFSTATAVTDQTGSFTLLAVPSGRFIITVMKVLSSDSSITLQAFRRVRADARLGIPVTADRIASARQAVQSSESMLWSRAIVTVTDQDVSGLALSLQTGPTISGRLRFDGTATAPDVKQLGSVGVRLLPVGGQEPSTLALHRIETDGAFLTAGYWPGRYALQAPPIKGWTLRAATTGNTDLLRSPLVLDRDVADVELLYTDQPIGISGSVRAGNTDTAAVLIPNDYATRLAEGMPFDRTIRAVQCDDGGTFQLRDLVAGAYLVVAVRARDLPLLRDPAYLDRLMRRASRVIVSEGTITSLVLDPPAR
jgi:hypothetical protein